MIGELFRNLSCCHKEHGTGSPRCETLLKDVGYMALGNQFTFLGLNLLIHKLEIIVPVPVLPISQY